MSSTPGKTKNLQTIILPESNIVLCDCPGLVFPQFANTKAELLLDGVLPIDQMREHTGPVDLLCMRIPKEILEATYGFNVPVLPESEGGTGIPTSRDLLVNYASKSPLPIFLLSDCSLTSMANSRSWLLHQGPRQCRRGQVGATCPQRLCQWTPALCPPTSWPRSGRVQRGEPVARTLGQDGQAQAEARAPNESEQVSSHLRPFRKRRQEPCAGRRLL